MVPMTTNLLSQWNLRHNQPHQLRRWKLPSRRIRLRRRRRLHPRAVDSRLLQSISLHLQHQYLPFPLLPISSPLHLTRPSLLLRLQHQMGHRILHRYHSNSLLTNTQRLWDQTDRITYLKGLRYLKSILQGNDLILTLWIVVYAPLRWRMKGE